jgi:hypothetical protein
MNEYSDFDNPITELERVTAQLKHLASEEEE